MNAMNRRNALSWMGGMLALPSFSTYASTKVLRIIVAAQAGGTPDIVARLLAERLAPVLGRPVIVENKPGAGGGIGIQTLLNAPADGDTLIVGASNILTEIPHVLKTRFNPLTDLRPIALLAQSNMVLVASPSLPKDFKAMTTYLQKSPGAYSYASYSTGTSSHYAGLLFAKRLGIEMQHIPFLGSPPALVEIMAGRVSIMFDGIYTSKPLIDSGKLNAYAVTSEKRSLQLPNTPTMGELGLPEINFSNWIGVIGSSKISEEVLAKLHESIIACTSDKGYQDAIVKGGFDLVKTVSMGNIKAITTKEHHDNGDIVKKFNININS